MLVTLLKPLSGVVSVFGVNAAARPMVVRQMIEPTVGLDPIARTDVWEYIAKLRDEFGMTVLMMTHYMDEADFYCDRLALMFFSSSALYPVKIMPGWLQVVTKINPRSYEVDALRGLLIGTPANTTLDVAVLVGVTIAGISAAAALLPRLAKG